MKHLNYFLTVVACILIIITLCISTNTQHTLKTKVTTSLSDLETSTQQLENGTENLKNTMPNYSIGRTIEQEEIIPLKQNTYINYNIPNVDTSFMAYMDYRCITDNSTIQYKMQKQAYTDENGFRKIGEDYCIALGSYYTNYQCGLRFKITLENGYSFTAIIADLKDDRHTDKETHTHIKKNGNVIEFIIDDKVMPNKALKLGNLGWYYEELDGQIIKIERIGQN